MRNKKALSPVEQIVIISICVMILIIALIVLYRAEILDWIKNLPGYGYSDEDQEITLTPDELASGVCTKGVVGMIGTFEGTSGFREQYIYFNENGKLVKSDFFSRGNDFANDGTIWLLKKDSWFGRDWFSYDLEFAKVRKGFIKINPDFLDLNSEIYHKMRFLPEYELMKNAVIKLYNASYGAGNYLCKPLEPPKFVPAWPEGSKIAILNIKFNELSPTIIDDRHRIDLSKYIYPMQGSGHTTYFWVEKGEDSVGSNKIEFIDVKMQVDKPSFINLNMVSFARVYPDNTFWLRIKDEATYQRLMSVFNFIIFKDVFVYSTIYHPSIPIVSPTPEGKIDDYGGPLYLHGIANHPHYYETNLRLDYQELKNYIDNNEKDTVIDVPAGRARYSDGTILESKGFISCNAIILDCGDKAVMAHAASTKEEYMFDEFGVPPEGNVVYLKNVVEELSKLLQEKGINPQECKSFINAGLSESLEEVTSGLKNAGISIESSKLDKNLRDIRFNPKTDSIIISYPAGSSGNTAGGK